MNPKIISIITPSYNQDKFIEETIQSVLSQRGDFYIDYIIMDGNSNDNSVDIIKKYETQLKENCKVKKIDGLTYFVKEKNDFSWNNCLGISYRWKSEKDNGQVDDINRGFKIAQGDIFAFLNSDDVYYQHALKRIMEMDWEQADFVYGMGMWISKDGKDILLYPTFKPTKYSFYYQCTLCQPAVFFKRTIFDELGDFSKHYFHALDYEYWMRALLNNKRFQYINCLLAKSRMYKENKSIHQQNDIKREIRELKNEYYNNSKLKLNKIKLLVNKIIIHGKTAFRANKLQKYLGTGIRHKFW